MSTLQHVLRNGFSNRNPIAVELSDTFEDITDRGNLRIRAQPVRVPLAEVAAYHAKHGGWVDKIIYANPDGTEWWGWAKSWQTRDGMLTRIGAGAYGDHTIWTAQGGLL